MILQSINKWLREAPGPPTVPETRGDGLQWLPKAESLWISFSCGSSCLATSLACTAGGVVKVSSWHYNATLVEQARADLSKSLRTPKSSRTIWEQQEFLKECIQALVAVCFCCYSSASFCS